MVKKCCLLCLGLLFLLGCQPQFDRSQMLSDIVNEVILPNHLLFVEKTAVFSQQAQAYAQQPTPAALQTLQTSWHELNIAWMQCAPFHFTFIQKALIHNRIDSRPANPSFIEQRLHNTKPLTKDTLATVGSSSQGVSALEYLLFDPASSADLPNNPRRQEYLIAAADLLHENARALYQLWDASGENYAQAFIAADMDGGELQGSINMLINLILEELGAITWQRLGQPLGKQGDQTIHPDLTEAPLSQSSLARLRATITALRDVYTGGQGVGLDDYLDFLEADYYGTPLSAAITQQFDTILTMMAAIDGSLEATLARDALPVDLLHHEVRDLNILFETDVVNQLGITLTITDNDGD